MEQNEDLWKMGALENTLVPQVPEGFPYCGYGETYETGGKQEYKPYVQNVVPTHFSFGNILQCIEVKKIKFTPLQFALRVNAPYEFYPAYFNKNFASEQHKKRNIMAGLLYQDHDEYRHFSSKESDKFKKSYDAKLYDLVETVCKQEKLDPFSLFAGQEKAYRKYHPGHMIKNPTPEAIERQKNTIYKSHERVWVTNPSDPRPMPDYEIEWFMKSIEYTPKKSGWENNLWIQKGGRDLNPAMIQTLENAGVCVKEIGVDLALSEENTNRLTSLIDQSCFGVATDTIRQLILAREEEGRTRENTMRFYMDTDEYLTQSLDPWSAYDRIVTLESLSAYLGNNFIGARPGDLAVKKALALLTRNLNLETAPDYIKSAPQNGKRTLFETGPVMWTIAEHLARLEENETVASVALPPEYFFPSKNGDYPSEFVPNPDDEEDVKNLSPDTVGIHGLQGLWTKSKNMGSRR